MTINASWSAQGWSASDAVVATISVDTGKVVVVDVVHLCSSCTECKKMEKKRKEEDITWMDYLAWFISHEPNCYVNQEGSAAVSCKSTFFKLHFYVDTHKKGISVVP